MIVDPGILHSESCIFHEVQRKMDTLLCEACWKNIFDTKAIEQFWKREIYDFCYIITWAHIAASAKDGCGWCSFQLSILPSPESVEWPSTWTITKEIDVILAEAYVMENASPKGLNHCQLDFGSRESPRDWHVELDLFIDKLDGVERPVTARPLQSRVNSAEAYSEIRSWFDLCRAHENCNVVPETTCLPSRVIEVVPTDYSGNPRPRLTEDVQRPYLALSYCWGHNQSYVLTSSNIETLKRSLETDLLPQTIQDAIEVTRQIGIKHLWVDSLCIMQDTTRAAAREDMDRELARMDQVYHNASMTIVAACASSAVDGFLKRKAVAMQHHFDIPCRLGEKRFFIAHIYEHKMYDDRKEPINTRAWAFQEQILSPRLLIYASHTLQWQCRTLTCNLGRSYHAPNPSAAPRIPSANELLFEEREKALEEDHDKPEIPHIFLQHWFRIVMSFSDRELSVPSDKLPAISALAASYSPIFGPTYHAGIWDKSAVQQLCWRRGTKKGVFRRPAQYRAPSWSWAALDGPIYFPSFLEHGGGSVCKPYSRFEILVWQTSLRANDVPFGEVTAGNLIVMAASREGNFDASSLPQVQFESDENLAEPKPMHTARAQIDVPEDSFKRRVHCIAMYLTEKGGDLQLSGLMLTESPKDNNSFQRIGSFDTPVSSFESRPLEKIQIV